MIRGVRGAIQVKKNDAESMLEAAEELMRALIGSNQIDRERVSAVFFTVTSDLDAAFPAVVRKKLNWDLVPFLCGREIPVEAALDRVLRVLILFETNQSQREISHQYLGGAASLRPDLKQS